MKKHTINQKFLLIPANPTPNGELHLGHISGPYLRADIFKRYVITRGGEAKMIFGTDAFDPYVSRQASLVNKTPKEVANENFEKIKTNLKEMNISFDLLINPIDDEFYEKYRDIHIKEIEFLLNLNKAELKTEQLPYDVKENIFITGADLEGTCKHCKNSLRGTTCENCGMHFMPEDILDVKYSEKIITDKLAFDNYFLKNINGDDVLKIVLPFCGNERFKNIPKTHCKKPWHRLTTYANWGLVFDKNRRIISSGHLYTYSLLAGDYYKEMYSESKHPYHVDSNVKVISFFGFDNIMSHLIGKAEMSACKEDYKLGEGFVMNHFYNLEGEKFSTSRNHVIWVRDIVKSSNVYEIRYYLASTSPSNSNTNFSAEEFKLIIKNEISEISKTVDETFKKLENSYGDVSLELINKFENILELQKVALDYLNFLPENLNEAFMLWLKTSEKLKTRGDFLFWLEGMAVLIYPIMTETGQNIWNQLKKEGVPNILAINGLKVEVL